ncbi:hypothetical protein [Glycomyces buryatensis]|uniref:Uncharacterized protein n=1 Tax=Glycomyces buryatensis TaxID=2570927 RepID=A0A4S8Q9Z2_9ACTN|nr:hypothetical protein [Glycomyces buryatensis]THV39632.1 hypothetical protein FAB82_17330 [Glycomyces buryatensis]
MGNRLPIEIEWIEIHPNAEIEFRRGAPWCESGRIDGIKFNARYWVVAFDEPRHFQLIGEASQRVRKGWANFGSRNERMNEMFADLAEASKETLFFVSRNQRISDIQSEYDWRTPWFVRG